MFFLNIKRFLYTFLLMFSTSVMAQSVIVSTKMDSTAIWMGEQTSIKLEVVQDKDAQLLMLIPSDTLTHGVEVLSVTEGDTTDIKNNRIQINKDIIITSFDSGFYYIPPIKCILDKDTFASESLSLKVVPVEVDQQNLDLKEIKDIWSPRFVLFDFIPGYVWITLLVLLVIIAVIYAYFKFFKKDALEKSQEIVQIPPYEKAMEELLKLKEEKLWQSGQDKLYYTRLIDILREYLNLRFGINAMEMTSTQILTSLRENKETKLVEKNMKSILAVADFVKFAKMRPLPDDNEASMRNAISFVEDTKPQSEEQLEENQNNKE